MATENQLMIRRWFEEVWNKGRASAIDEMLAPDGVIHGLGTGDVIGPDGFKPIHAAYRIAFPDLTFQVEDVVGDGDVVAMRWSGGGTHTGPFLGINATGRRVRFTGMVFARASRGRFIEAWNAYDQLGLLQQLGVVELPAV
jgi:steroid delta-isomerase-like uncharacterized protein